MPIRSRTLPAGLTDIGSRTRVTMRCWNVILSGCWLRRLLAGTSLIYHGPIKRYLSNARQRDPGYLLAADGVHINATGHWLMVREILRHWGVEDRAVEAAANGEQLFSGKPNGLAVLKLVQQKQRLLKDAWLTSTGHKRPGMSQGLPLIVAQMRAQKIDAEIDALIVSR